MNAYSGKAEPQHQRSMASGLMVISTVSPTTIPPFSSGESQMLVKKWLFPTRPAAGRDHSFPTALEEIQSPAAERGVSSLLRMLKQGARASARRKAVQKT